MSGKYRIGEDAIPHFVSFSVVYWIDALTRSDYKEIFIDSLRYSIKEKALFLHAWVIMTNHVHLIISSKDKSSGLSGILRDFKKYTSCKIIEAIAENPRESRKEWMLWMFARAGKKNSNNTKYQFWQQDNHPIELNTNIKMKQRLTYLHENPVRAGLVYEPQHYIYSSAIEYYTNEKGKIEIEHL
jgi:putative transposase